MLIYDALLSEKRVLFSGGLEHSAAEIGDYVLACGQLLSPPLMGGLGCKLYPYAALSNLDFLEEPGYVAGVTNPMFKQRQQWYDVCAEVDVGKLRVSKNKDYHNYDQERYFNLDLDFIRSLLARLQHNEASSSDEELRKAFESYTLMVLDLSLSIDPSEGPVVPSTITHEGGIRVSDLLLNKVRRFQKTTMFKVHKLNMRVKDLDLKSNLSLCQVEGLIRKLRLSQTNPAHTDAEVVGIYSQIMRYMQDEDSIIKLLSCLPTCREGGITILASGLFAMSEDVQRLSTEILGRLEQSKVGRHALSRLNYFMMFKYKQNVHHQLYQI